MKKRLPLLIFIAVAFLPGISSGADTSLEVPMLALKALGESRVDDCPYCVENLEKSAFRILNRYFKPGRRFSFDSSDTKGLLIADKNLKEGELLPTLYAKREKGKNGDGKEFNFPLLVFYFHTEQRHHAGIGKKIYTPRAVESVYQKKPKGKKALFKGKIRIAEYPYGNGKTFIYYRKRNILQVHCIIEELSLH